MPHVFSVDEIHAIERVISAPRFGTYLREKANVRADAMVLYQWNLEMSSALFIPLQILEVAVRNATAEAIQRVHGANWPRSPGFIRSLPSPSDPRKYDPKKDLQKVASQQPTTGKIIAELRFAFWETIYTAGQHDRIWIPFMYDVFPDMPKLFSLTYARQSIYNYLQIIRRLRNRIAHHEPIFSRSLETEFALMKEIINWRSIIASQWLDNIESVTKLVARKP